MSEMPYAEQSSESLPVVWTAGGMAASRPQSWLKNSESNSRRARNVVDPAKESTRCEEWQLIQRARTGYGEALQLVFRGWATDALPDDPRKETKKLDKDIEKLFKNSPPK
jgi:hypothetical protein